MLFAAVSVLLFPSAGFQAPYEVLDLGPFWGDASAAADLNDAGAVTGTVTRQYPMGSQFDGLLWYDGVATRLDALSGSNSFGLALTPWQAVVGYSEAGPTTILATQWEGTAIRDLGSLTGVFSRAQAVNDRGWVVGVSQAAWTVGLLRANVPVAWLGGAIYEIPGFGGAFSEALGVNDDGLVVGYSQDSNGRKLPFAFIRGQGTLPLPLLSPGGHGQASAVGDRGRIVGFASDSAGDPHAVLWEAGLVRDLGTLGGPQSFARDVNHDGLVVGNSGWSPGGGQGSHAFLWENGAMHDLNQLALPGHGLQILETAAAINDAGQIAGRALDPNGAARAYLATPLRFLLLGPVSGRAGGQDTIEVRHARPQSALTLVWGTRLGPGPAVAGCSGLAWGIVDPRPLGQVTADAAGEARLTVSVPPALAGRRTVVQALDAAACQLSTRLAFRFRP